MKYKKMRFFPERRFEVLSAFVLTFVTPVPAVAEQLVFNYGRADTKPLVF